MFQPKFVKTIETHILCSITFSRKSDRLRDSVERYGTDRQTGHRWKYNTVHALGC